MKSPVLLIALVAGLLSTIVTRSQDSRERDGPFDAPIDTALPATVRVHVEYIEMPIGTYTKLTAKPRHTSNDTDLRDQCTKLIETGDARILETLCVNARPGISATSESIGEFIFPTEPDWDRLIPLQPGGLGSSLPQVFPPVGGPPIISSFETKNTGPTLEVEAQLGLQRGVIDLRLTPTIVTFTGNVTWSNWKNHETSVNLTTPVFYVLSTKSGVTVVPGQPHFHAALSPRNAEGFTDRSRKVMVFIRADLLTTQKKNTPKKTK